VDRVKEITGKPELIEMREVEFCDPAAVADLFAERKYKAVIHFAGLKVSNVSSRWWPRHVSLGAAGDDSRRLWPT
jgi:UDP-glucose 4-epimerase